MGNWLGRSLKGGAVIASCLMWVGVVHSAHAALTCAITAPSGNVTIQPGGTVNYTGTVSGGRASYTYSWTFQGGTPGTSTRTTSSTSNSVSGVVYNTAGTYTTTLAMNDGSNPVQHCSANPTRTITVSGTPNVSINSTSQSCGGAGQPACRNTVVPQQPAPGASGSGNSTFHVFAVNDLGMHCGDLDTRISSILPPFNVMRAVVVQQPSYGGTPIRNPSGVWVSYSAGSNANDPALSITPTRVPATGGVFKTNFWDIGQAAYDPFYPASPADPFLPPYNLTLPADQGLPMPDLQKLYILGQGLSFNQQAMPGIGAPYQSNPFTAFKLTDQTLVTTQPFFTSFAFGYPATVNWHTAEGVPISVYDDFGRENAYPLMRVQARNASGTIVATTDTVVPISGEANCQACHAAPVDGGNGYGIGGLTDAGIPPVTSIEDPKFNQVPLGVSVEWASDHNLLKMHDLDQGTTLITGTTEDFPTKGTAAFKPVVCQTCHYTPALDLAQVGPNDVNGRHQSNNQSMSRVIHNFHGMQLDSTGALLFPPMAAPTQDSNGNITNQTQRLATLDQTCYLCHPGQRTKCLRGAMATGGMLCQDCHGNMTDVGNDFSKNKPGGAFILAGDFYTNPATPRVPWANEPSCGSCHTGDAVSSLAGSSGTITNLRDKDNNADNIRMLQAFRSTDTNKKPIVPTNKRFAEVTVSSADNPGAVGNPKLYRVSVSNHGNGSGAGIYCEACHGSTHAEWPNANPNANDNVTATQLQGHTGPITECGVCHGGSFNPSDSDALKGPHGMHVVGSTDFANGGHKPLAKGNLQLCAVCHGARGQGTVLSRAATNRTVGRHDDVHLTTGQPVNCGMCHKNPF